MWEYGAWVHHNYVYLGEILTFMYHVIGIAH